jgi:Fe-S cluster assembly protein SufD
MESNLKETLLNNYKSFENSIGKSFSSQRKDAILNFERLGFPTLKNEEWKYTNIAPALKKEYSFEPSPTLSKKDIEPFLLTGLKSNILVFVNGMFSRELSVIVSPESNLVVKEFKDADPAILEKYFGKKLSANDAFTYLNTAFAHHGSYIRIPKGKVVEEPVFIHYISDSRSRNIFSQPRNLFVAEENSTVKFVESYHTIGTQSAFSNVVTEIVLHKNAHIDYYKIQNDSPESYHVGTTQVHQEGKSYFSSTTAIMSSSIIRNNLNVVLNAEYSEATLYGLSLLKGRQHADNHTIVDHAKPNCYSNELYKAILDEKTSGVFSGKIFVRQDAQKTNAFQSNKNILLSKEAVMNTKPQLEIFADDVKCSHGATVGQLDEEPLFYLRSRGISEENAKALLILAFAQDIIDHIKIDPLKEYLLKEISGRLGQ